MILKDVRMVKGSKGRPEDPGGVSQGKRGQLKERQEKGWGSRGGRLRNSFETVLEGAEKVRKET